MSKQLSHREMKAATRVLGSAPFRINDLSRRTRLLEDVLKILLIEQNRSVQINADGSVELVSLDASRWERVKRFVVAALKLGGPHREI